MTTQWAVYKNGRALGIVETNYAWARAYWAYRCGRGARYALRPVN